MTRNTMANVLPDNLLSAVERVVRDEKILWAGQPDARAIFRTGFWIYLFAVPWTVFSLFWESFPVGLLLFGDGIMSKGMPSAMPWVMAVFGIPFIVIGFGMLSTPFFARKAAQQTAFVITGTKLGVVKLGKSLESKLRLIADIKRVETTEKADGSGALKLIFGYGRDSDGDRTTDCEDLTGIENVRQVEDLINGLRTPATPAAG
jgi:hypothetical protein